VVAEYLSNSGLQLDLDKVGFNLIGFGCTNLHRQFRAVTGGDFEVDQRQRIIGAAVLSGNRNFEGPRQSGRAGQLSGVAAAGGGLCAGGYGDEKSRGEPIGNGKDGKPVI